MISGMKMKSEVLVLGVTGSKGTFEDKSGKAVAWDKSTMFVCNQIKNGVGFVADAYKFGSAAEFEHIRDHSLIFPAFCEIEVELQSKGKSDEKPELVVTGFKYLSYAKIEKGPAANGPAGEVRKAA